MRKLQKAKKEKMTKFEYRLIWKRKGCNRKFRRFARLESAKKYSWLLSDEPWKFVGAEPDDYVTLPESDGYMQLKGETWREVYEYKKQELPPIEYWLIERRKIGDWEKE